MSYRFHAMQSLGPSARPSTIEDSLDFRFRNLPDLRLTQQRQVALIASLRAPAAPGHIVPRRTDVTPGTSLRGLFAGFGEDAGSLNAAMTQVVQALRDAYAQGQQKINDSSGSGILDFITGSSDTEKQISGSYAAISGLIDTLDTTLRQQVLDGHRADGSTYTLDDWKRQAAVIGSDIKAQTGYAWDSSGLNLLEQTASATGAEVKRDAAIGLGAAAAGAAVVGGFYLLMVSGLGGQLLGKLFSRRRRHAMAGLSGTRRRKRRTRR